jgi:acyl carrier protein
MTADHDEKLRAIFVAVLQLPPDSDVSRVRQLTEPAWDSLAHVTLVSAVESEFSISIPAARSLQLTSHASFALLLRELL